MADEYICDDRIYESGGLLDQIRAMTDEERKSYIKEFEEKRKKED